MLSPKNLSFFALCNFFANITGPDSSEPAFFASIGDNGTMWASSPTVKLRCQSGQRDDVGIVPYCFTKNESWRQLGQRGDVGIVPYSSGSSRTRRALRTGSVTAVRRSMGRSG